jgi:peptidoglycan/xylan/chitin deacetylase (PgdA/CDA1 family)
MSAYPSPPWAALFAVILPTLAEAAPESPEEALFNFYHAIQTQQCDEAAAKAKGYAAEQCRQTVYLKMGGTERLAQPDERHATVKTHLDYRKTDSAAMHSCEVIAPMVLETEWKIDFQNLKAQCQPVAQAGAPATPATNPAAAPAEPAPPPPPTGLLRLWPAEDLRGHPGEEHITALRQPDLNQPELTAPTETLPKLDAQRLDSIRRVRLPPGKNLIALTFDLCEQADDITGYDRGIVNYLRDNQIAATFFAGGKWMRSHPQRAMQLMADPHFEIGNHGWTHGNLRVLTGQKMQEQIVWTQAQYAKLRGELQQRAQQASLQADMQQIPKQPATLRFPYGTCSPESLAATNALGLDAVQWDVVSGDAAPRMTAKTLARGVIANTRPGSIIVFHANGRGHGTADALPDIVAALRAKGYGFATVSQLLQEGTAETAKECYELKPGDNAYIDKKFGEGTQ